MATTADHRLVRVVIRCTLDITNSNNCNLRRTLRTVPFMVNTQTHRVLIITVDPLHQPELLYW